MLSDFLKQRLQIFLPGKPVLPGGTRVIELPKPDKAPATGMAAKLNFVEAQP